MRAPGTCTGIRYDYEFNFQGMTAEPVLIDALLAARERMVREIQHGLDDSEQRFLLSLVAGTLDWLLLGIAHTAQPFNHSDLCGLLMIEWVIRSQASDNDACAVKAMRFDAQLFKPPVGAALMPRVLALSCSVPSAS